MDVRGEKVIAELARGQRGLVTVAQLHGAGLDDAAIRRRRLAGRLHSVHRGVYFVGHAAAPGHAMELAAVLSCGAGSVVSHLSAFPLWRLDSRSVAKTPIDVTVAGRDPGRKRGIRVHRVARLLPCEVSCVDGIPVTSPARTLLDVATLLPFHDLEVAYADACARRLVRVREMTALLERARGRAGVAPLRRLVELDQADGLTRSEAERKLLTLVRTARLPAPSTNVRVGQSEVDCLWRSEKVVVEVDGYAFHSGKRAFERDRERDAGLVARGYVVLRITWAKLSERPASVIARGAAALAVRSESA